MNGLVRYEQVQRELDTMSLIERETIAELKAAHVLTALNYRDVFPAQLQEMSRSAIAQYNQWLKSDSAPSTADLALCINISGLLESFMDYVHSKYADRPKERAKWEHAFANPEFKQGVTNFLAQKSFEAKSELEAQGRTAFFTELGLRYYVMQWLAKTGREMKHEMFWRGHKLLKDNPGMRAEEAARIVISWLDSHMQQLEEQVALRLARQERLAPQQRALLN